jgi:hypothetical protein
VSPPPKRIGGVRRLARLSGHLTASRHVPRQKGALKNMGSFYLADIRDGDGGELEYSNTG